MNNIKFPMGELNVRHKNNCVNVRGDVAKAIILGLAILIVISGVASILDQSNRQIDYGS